MSDAALRLVLGAVLAAPPTEVAPYGLPTGAHVLHMSERADGVVAAFYVGPYDPWCGVGAGRDRLAFMKVAVFDADGGLMWQGKAPPLAHVKDAFVLPSLAVVVWGFELDRGLAVYRLNGSVPERLAGRVELDGGTLTAVEMDADGGTVIRGTFTSVRGQSRPGVARFLPTGSLDR
ncbi:MAG: delta-60 repeat domain-containing protein [Vicinamibacteria bacterium]